MNVNVLLTPKWPGFPHTVPPIAMITYHVIYYFVIIILNKISTTQNAKKGSYNDDPVLQICQTK